MDYIHRDVLKPTGSISPGAPKPKSPNITILLADDIVSEPVRNSGGVKMQGAYSLKPGAMPIKVYLTPSTQNPTYSSDGEEDTISIAHNFEGIHPGDSLEVNEFVQNLLGKNLILIIGNCQDDSKRVFGTKCAPVQLKPTYKSDNESTGHTLTFEQFQKTALLPGFYSGSLPDGNPHTVADVATLALTQANGNYYQLPSLSMTAAITVDSIDLPNGSFVTLIGGGGSDPATLTEGAGTAATVILKDGTDWTALNNAQITFEVMDGGSTVYLIERSRS